MKSGKALFKKFLDNKIGWWGIVVGWNLESPTFDFGKA